MNILNDRVRGDLTGALYGLSFVHVRENFMKFWDQASTGVIRQGQNDFPLAAQWVHVQENSCQSTIFEQFYYKIGGYQEVNFVNT